MKMQNITYLSDLGISVDALVWLYTFCVVFILVSVLLAAAIWILQAIGLHDLSGRIGLKHTWFGFVPVFADYAFGSLARKKGVLSVLLPVLSGLVYLFGLILTVTGGGAAIRFVFAADSAMQSGLSAISESDIVSLAMGFIPLVIMLPLSLAYHVVRVICLYSVTARFNRVNAVMFTVLGAIIPVAIPFFIFSMHNRQPENFGAAAPQLPDENRV